MQYELLRASANGLEMPDSYYERFYAAEEAAVDLAHDSADGGYTGRATVRNGYDEAVISVRARGPLTLVYEHRSGDIPTAYWNGQEFDYYQVRYSPFGASERMRLTAMFAA